MGLKVGHALNLWSYLWKFYVNLSGKPQYQENLDLDLSVTRAKGSRTAIEVPSFDHLLGFASITCCSAMRHSLLGRRCDQTQKAGVQCQTAHLANVWYYDAQLVSIQRPLATLHLLSGVVSGPLLFLLACQWCCQSNKCKNVPFAV